MINNHLLRFRTRLSIALALLACLLVSVGVVWAATYTASDNFETGGYSGGTGWNGSWQEIEEFDGPSYGDERIVSDGGDFSLRVQDDGSDGGGSGNGEGVRRAINLENAVSATISFNYRRNGLDRASDYVTVDVSTDGNTWFELGRFQGPTNDVSYQSFSTSIPVAYLSSTTEIRFFSSPTLGGTDRVYFDNVRIEYEVSDATDDWGDAPDNYGTTSSASGPSHIVVSGLEMGSAPDAESDGLPGPNADGDDNAGRDDEDGVTILPTGTIFHSLSVKNESL